MLYNTGAMDSFARGLRCAAELKQQEVMEKCLNVCIHYVFYG